MQRTTESKASYCTLQACREYIAFCFVWGNIMVGMAYFIVRRHRWKMDVSGPFRPFTNITYPAWLSNYIHYKIWDEITNPFTNFTGATFEVWDWMDNCSPQLTRCVITYSSFSSSNNSSRTIANVPATTPRGQNVDYFWCCRSKICLWQNAIYCI